MKLIKPNEISAKIMTLIDEAETKIIIVSPYNKITGWKKLINRIEKAKQRGIKISWYSRKNYVDKSNFEEVVAIGIEPILIDDLHAKIYFNDDYAIVTSMNLCKQSDEKSIDIGYMTETKEEYDNIYRVFKTYISIDAGITKSITLKESKPEIPPKIELYNEANGRFAKGEELKLNEFYINSITSVRLRIP